MNEIFENINEKFFNYFQNTFDQQMKTPQLLKCGFEKAFQQTLANGPVKMKPFLIYLHDNNEDCHEIFFMENICNDMICDYLLSEDWPIWPIDVSDGNDKSSFFNLIGQRLDSTISIYNAQLPMMLMFVREGMKIIEAAHMCSKDSNTIFGQLIDQGEYFKSEKEMRIQLLNSKRDQNEYKKAQERLVKEKEKEENERRENEKLEQLRRKQEEEEKLNAELNRHNQIEYAKTQVKCIESNVSNFTLRFRFPNNEIVTREFSPCQSINEVLYFVESNGYLRSEMKVMFSYPPKNMCEMSDVNVNLNEAGVGKREVVNVQKLN